MNVKKIRRLILLVIGGVSLLATITALCIYFSSTAIFRNKTFLLPEYQYIAFNEGDSLTVYTSFMDSQSFFYEGDISDDRVYFVDDGGNCIKGRNGKAVLSKKRTFLSPYDIFDCSFTIDTNGMKTCSIEKIVLDGREYEFEYCFLERVEKDEKRANVDISSTLSTFDKTGFRTYLRNKGTEDLFFKKIEFYLNNNFYSYGDELQPVYRDSDTNVFIEFEDSFHVTSLRPKIICITGGEEFVSVQKYVTRYGDIRLLINDDRIIEIINERGIK